MSIILEGAILPPHHLQNKSASFWPSPYHPQYYPAPASSPALMSPRSLPPYMSHLPESPLPSQEINSQPTAGWYAPSISAPECHGETTFTPYGYIPSQASSVNLSPPTSTSHYTSTVPVSTAQSSATMSPGTVYSRDSVVPESARPSEEPHSETRSALHQSTPHYKRQSHLMNRSHSNSDSLHSVTVDGSWTMNGLGIQTHEAYYTAYPTHSPRLSDPSAELSSNQMASPQPRRHYTAIAPLPTEAPRSHGIKREREEDEEDEPKRRKRSDSQISTQFELSDEDKLLLQLRKDKSPMPWKEIAARFQTDLNKTYQIPALQMRLKRLKERMRVWTEQDVQALRKAHDFWVQSKFDIIAQKMLEYGTEEKWTARQCSRKWEEIDPAPIPYAHFEHHHVQQGFAPYAMSPIEPTPINCPPFFHT